MKQFERWQDKWMDSNKGRFTFQLIPTVTNNNISSYTKSKSAYVKWIYRLITGNIPTNEYLFRFKLTDDP